MKSEALIVMKSLRHVAQPLGSQDFKKSATRVNTLSVSISHSQENSIWFMQVLSLANCRSVNPSLKGIVTQAVLRGVKQRR